MGMGSDPAEDIELRREKARMRVVVDAWGWGGITYVLDTSREGMVGEEGKGEGADGGDGG